MKRKTCPRILFALLGSVLALGPRASGAAEAQPTGSIEGRVLNTRSGEYLEKARLTVEGTTLEAFSDSSGQFLLAPLPAGAVRVRVFFTGLDPLAETVTVAAGQIVHRDFNLAGPGLDSDRGGVVRLSEFVVDASKVMDGAAMAINEQRFAPNISNVVAANEFGISADGSVGEFLKYLPGISVNYVGGTANTISMNGVPANNVPVTAGGFDLASTSSASTSRAVELLQFSIQNVARIEVLHSPTPESQGSALAGSINLVPRSAFELPRARFSGSAYVMMRDNDRSFQKTAGPRKYATRKAQPGFDFSYLNPVNKRFGFTLSGSYSNQYLPQDTMSATWRGAGSATTGLSAPTAATQYPDTTPDKPYLTDYSYSDITKFNVRSSLGTTIDYKFAANDTVSFAYNYGNFSSEFNQDTVTFFVNYVQPGDFSATTTRGVAGKGEIRNANASRWRTGSTNMPTLKYRHTGPIWKAEAGAGYSHSTNFLRDTERGYFGSVLARRTGVTVSYDDNFYLRPGKVTVADGATGAPVDPYNLGSYALSTAGSPNPRDSIDVKRSAYANLARDFLWQGMPLSVKGGLDVRGSMRDMRGTSSSLNYVGADGRASTTPTGTSDDGAAAMLDESFSQRIPPFGFPRTQWISADKTWDWFGAHPGYFTADPNGNYRNAVSLSKRTEETIYSAFLRGDLGLFRNRLKLVGGLRMEQTDVRAEGPLTDPTRNFQRDAAGKVILGANGRPLTISSDSLSISKLTFLDRGMHARKEYLRLFPNLNASFSLRENLMARASFYTSVGRPDLNQYAGGITLPDIESPPSSSNVISGSNAGIKAWSANTTKLRFEYYFEGVGQISVGGFQRNFKNFFGSTVAAATPAFLELYNLDPATYGAYSVSTQQNVSGLVKMTGWEFDYKQALKMLPHWARGVQVFANASMLRTTGDATANFDGFIPRTYNWGASLTREKYSLRANWNYRGRARLGALAVSRGIEPGTYSWNSKALKLDLQGEYFVRKNLALFGNLRNVTDDPEDTKIFAPRTPLYARFRGRQDFGSSWTFGVKGSF